MAGAGQPLAGDAFAAFLTAQTANAQRDALPAATKTGQLAMTANDFAPTDAYPSAADDACAALDLIAGCDAKRCRTKLFAINITHKEYFTFTPGDPDRGAVAAVSDPRVIRGRILVDF